MNTIDFIDYLKKTYIQTSYMENVACFDQL